MEAMEQRSTGELDELVRSALAGRQEAWDAIVARFANLVWSIVRGYGLGGGDAEDAYQTTWLRLLERLDRIHSPEALGSWLATTARRECMRLLQRASREMVTGDDAGLDRVDAGQPPAWMRLLVTERDAALWAAFETLAERCRRLLRLLMADPPASYQEISAGLGMQIGSIGPTRRRCLDDLKQRLAVEGIDGLDQSSP